MNKTLKKAAAIFTFGAIALSAVPAMAQGRWDDRHDRRDDRRDERRDDRRDNRWDRRDDRRPDRVVVVKDRRPDRVVVVDRRGPPPRVVYNYDYNRPDPRYRGYYAERYYRGGNNYAPVRVSRQTRIYRGNDDRYYCRRSDGTTGLILGAALGGVLGNQIDRGGSGILGTVLGAGAGGLLGQSIDRGGVSCR